MSAPTGNRTADQVRADLESEREQLAEAVGHLRESLGNAADIRGKLKGRLPLVAAGAASMGFVYAGGLRATVRYLARRRD